MDIKKAKKYCKKALTKGERSGILTKLSALRCAERPTSEKLNQKTLKKVLDKA